MRSTRGTGVKGHDPDCCDTSEVSSEVTSNLQQELSSVLRKMRNRQGPCIDISNFDRAKSGRSVTYTGGGQLGRGFEAPKGNAVGVAKDKDDTRLLCHSPLSPGHMTLASGVIATEQKTPVQKDSQQGWELSRYEVDDSHRSEMWRRDESARQNWCKEPVSPASQTLRRDVKHTDSSEEKRATENETFLEGDTSGGTGSKLRDKAGFGSCVNSGGSSKWDAGRLEGAFLKGRGRSLCQSERDKTECVRAPSGECSTKQVLPSATLPGLPVPSQVVSLTKSSDVIRPHPRAPQVLDPSSSPLVTGSFGVSPAESSQVQKTFRASKGISGSILQQQYGSAKPHQPNRSATAQGPSGSSQSRGPNRSATTQGPSGSSQSRGPNRSLTAQGPSGSSQGPGWFSQVKTTCESPTGDVPLEDACSLSPSDTIPNEVTRIFENKVDRVSCDGSSVTQDSCRSSRSDLDQSHALSVGDSATTEDYMYLWDGAAHLPPGHRTRFMSFSIGSATCCTGDDTVYDPRHIPECSWGSGRGPHVGYQAQRTFDAGDYVKSGKSDWADLIRMEDVVLRSFSQVSRSVSAVACTERRGEVLRSRNEMRKSSSEPLNVTRQLSEIVCSDGTRNETSSRHGTNSVSKTREAHSSSEQKTTARAVRSNSEQVRRDRSHRSSMEQMSFRGSERIKVERRKFHPPKIQTRSSLAGVGPGPSSRTPVYSNGSVITRPVITRYGDQKCPHDWHPDTFRHRVTAPELTSLPRLGTKNRYRTMDKSMVRGHRSVIHPYPSVVDTTPQEGRISSIGLASCSDIRTYRKNPVHHGRRPNSVETCCDGATICERPLQRHHQKNARKNRRKLAVDTSFSDDTTYFPNTSAATYVNVPEFCDVVDEFEDSLIKYVHVNDLSLLNDDIQRRYRMHLGGATGIQSVVPPSAGLLHRFTCCFCCHRTTSALDGMGPSKQNIPTVLVHFKA